MRKTAKIENGFYALKKGQEIWGEENGVRLVQIIGQLEDAEEKYGIDLLLLIGAMSRGIYRIGFGGSVKYYHQSEFWLSSDTFGYKFVCDTCYSYLKDYGMRKPGGWVLKKEELE